MSARVLIVDPHEACRRAAAELIGSSGGDLAVWGETAGGHDTPARAAGADAVLLGMPDASQVGMIRRIASAGAARIAVLGERTDGAFVVAAVQAGATGFAPKSARPAEIREMVRSVLRGEPCIHPSATLAGLVWAAGELNRRRANRTLAERLTPREREVLGLMAQGLAPSSIASRLSLSRRTVEFHLANVYRKLGVHGRVEAVRVFIEEVAAQP